jgi:hypothetical protein
MNDAFHFALASRRTHPIHHLDWALQSLLNWLMAADVPDAATGVRGGVPSAAVAYAVTAMREQTAGRPTSVCAPSR